MATTILIVCPECGKQIKAPDNVLGKKVRCKFCQAAFVASKGGGKASAAKSAKPPAGKPAKPVKPAKPSKPAVKEEEDDEDANPYGLVDVHLGARCPDCANEMDEDQIVCLHCGYNTQTREKAKTLKTYDTSTGDQLMWMLPGIVCALVVLGIIGFNVWYLLQIDKLIDKDDPFYISMWGSGGIKLWVVITSLFIVFFTGKFAIKRLILNFKRPEVEKLK